jgi:hypothetical protein
MKYNRQMIIVIQMYTQRCKNPVKDTALVL